MNRGGQGESVEVDHQVAAGDSPIAVAEVGLDGVYLWANQAMGELLARHPDDLVGTGFVELIAPVDQDDARERLARLGRGEATSFRADERYMRGDGREIWLTTNFTTITGPDGHPAHYLLLCVDIDTRVRDLHALARAEDRARRLADLSPDGVVVADLDGRMLYCNIIYAGLSGLGPTGRDGIRIAQGAAADDTGPSAERWAKVRAGQTVRNSLEAFEHPDGTSVQVEFSSTPIDYDGRPAVLSVVRDVSDRIAREGALVELRSRERLSFERAPIGQALVALDGRWIATNPALCRLLGVDPGDLDGRTFMEFTHPDDSELDMVMVQRTINGELPGYSLEKRYLRPDGELVYANLHVSLVRDDEGRPLYFISQVEDLTERRRREIRLEQLSNELTWTNEALTQTMASALADQARYRALMDNVHETVAYLFDRDHRIKVASVGGPDERGWAEEPVVGKTPDDILLPADAARVNELIERAFAGQHTSAEMTMETTGRHELLDVVAVEASGEAVPAEVLLVGRDMTDRKAKEQALAAAHARFAALVEHSSDMVTITAPDGAILYTSPGSRVVLGCEPDETLGRQITDFVHPDDIRDVIARRDDVLADEGTLTNFTCRLLHTDHGWRHVEVTSSNRLADPAVNGIVSNCRDVTDRVDAAEWLEHQAMHDPLTDLPNRALFLDRLERSLAHAEHDNSSCAVLFLDLDRFKGINDSLGHRVGDQVLVAVASRLTEALRPFDSVARLGGDEFVVLADSLEDPAQAPVIAERMRRTVAEPVVAGGHNVTVGCSVGIALSRKGHRPETLLQEADIALYRAKERGRNRSEIYDQAMQIRARRRLETEQTIRWALDRDRIEVVYQPIVDLVTGAVTGTEALARIRLQSGQLLGADEFIPVAEDTGLIVPLGEAVFRSACAQQAKWMAAGSAPSRLSVNVSARQLLAAEFVTFVGQTIKENGLEPSHLCLELTESALIDAGLSVRRHIDDLKGMGVSLALDDFGTGWSSLAYLRRFPLDTLKIDRSFVSGLGTDTGDSEVVKAIIGLGHALDLTTVAEGVENARHEALLVKLHCDLAQGDRYAMPLTPDQMADLDRVFALEGAP